MKGDTLIIVPGAGIPVFDNGDGSYSYESDFMIDGDGTGSSHGDPDYQNTTSYKPDLNADIDPYIVLPPEVIRAVAPKVIGCKALVENLFNGKSHDAVVGDIGPRIKIGEGSIDLADDLGVPDSPTEGGDQLVRFRYTFWPGIPAVVDDKIYSLQSTG